MRGKLQCFALKSNTKVNRTNIEPFLPKISKLSHNSEGAGEREGLSCVCIETN